MPWLADARYAMVAVIIANVWYGVTFFAIMILAALQSVPEELYEAAALDGAGKVRTLFQITIPYIRTTLALTVLLRVIWIFNFPDLIFGMTGGGPANETHIVTTWMIKITQQGDYGEASALGLIVVAVLLRVRGLLPAGHPREKKGLRVIRKETPAGRVVEVRLPRAVAALHRLPALLDHRSRRSRLRATIFAFPLPTGPSTFSLENYRGLFEHSRTSASTSATA